MLTSRHFKDDPVLEDVAADKDRISRTRHATDPAVGKIQTALLLVFDPGCLPVFGPDGSYGDETAKAIRRFKVEVLEVPVGEVIDDVGSRTVLELDRLMRIREQSLDSAARIILLDGWLNAPIAGGLSSAVTTSGVQFHPNGETAFRALHDAIARCTGENAIIAVAGWDFFTETPLLPGVTVGKVLTDAAGRGVRVRAMLSHFPVIDTPIGPINAMAGDNTRRVVFINGLPNGAAIHDKWVLHHDITVPSPIGSAHVGIVQIGMHHQKIWVVFDGERLQVFCGGVDLNPNRSAVDRPAGSPPPFHDVQVELSGPAAVDVYGVVRSRWNDHPERPAGVELPPLPSGGATAGQRTRMFTTFGNPTAFAGLQAHPYPFAPTGSKTIRQFLSHAIAKASNFIYLEDQYLVDASIGRELAARMPTLAGLVIVMPDDNSVDAGELFQPRRRRKAVLDPLAPFMDKIAIVNSVQFVHAKLWIFDDTVAMVGSANSNRRGYAHDSEISVAFGDITEGGSVQALRTVLWNTHLGAQAAPANAAPAASIGIWKSASTATGARVNQYPLPSGVDPNPTKGLPLITPEQFWDEIVDPDCP